LSEANRKTYKITYYNGTTVIVYNLKKFAEDNEIRYNSLWSMRFKWKAV